MKNTIRSIILITPLTVIANNPDMGKHKHVEVKSESLVGKDWKGSCEPQVNESGGKKCDWQFKEDKTGKQACVVFADEYCTGATHYTTDLTFKYEPGKKKDTYLLSFDEGPHQSKLIKFVAVGAMLTETVLEATSRKAKKADKVKAKPVTYTGY